MPTAIENWTLVSRLFDEAADLEPSSRAAFLDLRCGDAAVRARVEALLRADQHTTPLLLDPRAALAPALWLDLEAEESARPEFPPTLGHFRILGELGRGGMGRVLRARDERLQRDVALKVVSDIADPRARERLLREARNASALRHPHIVTVFDVGAADGIDFIVLELVEGKTLASLIPQGGLALTVAVAWARQIADALAVAHAAGIVHRDLKTQNVMIDANGDVKVLDFGIARRLDSEPGPEASAGPGVAGRHRERPVRHADRDVAGAGRRPDNGRSQRRLLVRLFAVRNAHRPLSVPPRQRRAHSPRGARVDAAAAHNIASGRAAAAVEPGR